MNITETTGPSILRFVDENDKDLGWRSLVSVGVPAVDDVVISNAGDSYTVLARRWDWKTSPSTVVIKLKKS